MIPIPHKTRQWDWSYTTSNGDILRIEIPPFPFQLNPLFSSTALITIPWKCGYQIVRDLSKSCQSPPVELGERREEGEKERREEEGEWLGMEADCSCSHARRTCTLIGVSFKRIPSKSVQRLPALMRARCDGNVSVSCSTSLLTNEAVLFPIMTILPNCDPLPDFN